MTKCGVDWVAFRDHIEGKLVKTLLLDGASPAEAKTLAGQIVVCVRSGRDFKSVLKFPEKCNSHTRMLVVGLIAGAQTAVLCTKAG